ncbi:MAG: hypothetical protein JO210_14395 [Acidobacteriaceae bacterium]|nr:hypothetical protein [Acidobacteriaceae bacterium]
MATNLQGRSVGRRATPFRQSLSVGEFTHIMENMDLFLSCCEWIESYLARPHPQLGRTGSVCPFAAPALAKDSLRIAVVRLDSTADKRTQIAQAIEHYREAFLCLGSSGEAHMLHSILILFPDVSPEEAPDLIDRTKEQLKTTFVEQGLMLGEFHVNNESHGLHNPAFRPLRSPVPMLVIRRMVATDFVFLNRSEYDTATRLRYLEIYLQVSGIADAGARKKLECAVASLKSELQDSASLHGES